MYDTMYAHDNQVSLLSVALPLCRITSQKLHRRTDPGRDDDLRIHCPLTREATPRGQT